MEIKTKRLILRSMTLNDVNDIYDYSKNTMLSQFMYHRRNGELEQIVNYVNENIKQDNIGNKDSLTLSIVLDNKVIGEVALLFFDEGIEIFWIINDKYQRLGYAYEASSAFIDYIKSNTSIKMISAHCDTRNIASKNLMEKLGFNYLGISERIYPDDRSPAFEHSYELVLGE